MSRAVVPKLVEVHAWSAKRRSHRIPVVEKTALAQPAPGAGDEQPRNVEQGGHVEQRLARRWRQGHDTRLAVLRELEFACPVKALTCEELSGAESHIRRKENHRPERRSVVAVHCDSNGRKLVKLRLDECREILTRRIFPDLRDGWRTHVR